MSALDCDFNEIDHRYYKYQKSFNDSKKTSMVHAYSYKPCLMAISHHASCSSNLTTARSSSNKLHISLFVQHDNRTHSRQRSLSRLYPVRTITRRCPCIISPARLIRQSKISHLVVEYYASSSSHASVTPAVQIQKTRYNISIIWFSHVLYLRLILLCVRTPDRVQLVATSDYYQGWRGRT